MASELVSVHMGKRRNFAPCVFVPFRLRDQLPTVATVYDVSSYADHPFCTLSPFWPHGGIPVPGMIRTTSDSVEGIWQGLKLIDGKIAPRYRITLASGISEEVCGRVKLGYQTLASVDIEAARRDPDTLVVEHAGRDLYLVETNP